MREFSRHVALDFEDWSSLCRGRANFPSRRVANGRIRVLKRRSPHHPRSTQLIAYRCHACHRFHLGHRAAA